jgi:Ser/Thr protein kinase RdoA (MazF antagonist)
MPRHFIHGDFGPGNLRFTDGQLTALDDFDYARVDIPMSDLARAWRGERGAIVDGYREVTRLDEDCVAALRPLWQAAALDFAWAILKEGYRRGRYNPSLAWCVAQLH